MSTFQAAVLEVMMNAGRSLTVREITKKLSADYDEPPTPAAVLRVHASRMGRRTSGEPTDN